MLELRCYLVDSSVNRRDDPKVKKQKRRGRTNTLALDCHVFQTSQWKMRSVTTYLA
jgi:hypothetical protein